ncbi:MAG: LytR C-terminal domain-containing protein [Nocardioides sp.]
MVTTSATGLARLSGPRPDERGVLFPSPVVLLSVIAIAMAAIAFVVTRDDPPRIRRIDTVAQPAEPGEPDPVPRSATPTPTPAKPKPPAVRRGQVYVEIYNNSGVPGLASVTARKAAGAGWSVVGSDNWIGTIPSSTVYYPPRLNAAGKLLARDLGIVRMRPSVVPMRFDRLTVILTED